MRDHSAAAAAVVGVNAVALYVVVSYAAAAQALDELLPHYAAVAAQVLQSVRQRRRQQQ